MATDMQPLLVIKLNFFNLTKLRVLKQLALYIVLRKKDSIKY